MNRTIDRNVPKLGVRSTRQRTAVVSVLKDLDYFASAKAIHQELTKRDLKVGLTTVYRTLQSLTDIEAVDVLHMSNGETLYRHCLSMIITITWYAPTAAKQWKSTEAPWRNGPKKSRLLMGLSSPDMTQKSTDSASNVNSAHNLMRGGKLAAPHIVLS
ncbi:Ferric uptake regulatory protein [Corynebacterium pseudotuberculosis]|nr:Ferric uptake regulatory protein [Corynebacterium pseudotuberculosis]